MSHIGKRTRIDFSKHELMMQEQTFSGLVLYMLYIPGRGRFHEFIILSGLGVTSVTGDFGNWIFNREIGFGSEDGICDSYWSDKLKHNSIQDPYELDPEVTIKEIDRLLEEKTKPENSDEEDEDDRLDEEEIEYLEELRECVYDEIEFNHKAYRDSVGRFREDYDSIPREQKLDSSLLAVFDAFDEINNRISATKKN